LRFYIGISVALALLWLMKIYAPGALEGV